MEMDLVPKNGIPSAEGILAALAEWPGAEGMVDHVEVHPSLLSTNTTALEDPRYSLLVVALEQTGGRGRHGTSWASPRGGLYLSYVPPTRALPGRPTDISPLAALAVADAVDGVLSDASVTTVHSLVKWPNDVLLGDGKVAGVLVQSRSDPLGRGNGSPRTVVGIGVNVNTVVSLDLPDERHPEEWLAGPCSLMEVTGGPVDPFPLLVAIVGGLANRLGHGLDEDAIAEYRSRCITLGKRVVLTEGDRRLNATALDVSPDGGALVLKLEDGQVRRVTSGDVRHVREIRG